MDMQEILSKVITSTNEIFEAEAGSVALLEPSGRHIVIRAAVGAGADVVRGMSLPITKGVIGWVASREIPALIPDVSQDKRWFKNVDKESGFYTKSIMCVPMQADGHTIGVIELMNMRQDYLSDNGLKILRVIADHAALAIENARLLNQTRQQSEEQVLLFEAMTIVTSDLDLDTVLEAVSHQMVEALKADLCIISRWDDFDNHLHIMQRYTGPGIECPAESIRPLGSASLPLSILESQDSVFLDANDPNIGIEGKTWLEQLEVQALFLIPLIYRGHTIGLVEIGRLHTTETIAPGELRLAETMTAQATVAIEHARLYDEATHRLAEAKVLQEVMVAAASTLDFNRVLTGTIEALHRTLGIERLGFFLPTDEGTIVATHPATIGFAIEAGNPQVPTEGSAVGWVIRNGKPLLLTDVKQTKHYYELAVDTQSELCVPVLLNGQVAAVLNAESPRLNAFDQEDLRLFRAIAAELAVALENAQLFEEIRTAEANYRDLFDNANDFIITLDSNFNISSANKMALRSTGYRLDELIGTHIMQFIPLDSLPRLFKLLKGRLASSQAPATFEIPVKGKDQRETVLEVTMRVQRIGGRPSGIHCVARNITQRRKLEQQLRQTEKLSTIGKLVAGVAHELNNPLGAIIGYASLLQDSNLPQVYQEDLAIIFRQAERARIIVRDLLTFARKIDLEPEPVDLNEIIQTSLLLMKPHLQDHSIQVTTSLDFGMAPTMADPYQLEQVFTNLLTNAVQAIATVTQPGQITVETRRVKNSVLLSFADNGPGIPDDTINRIFDPFFSTKQVGEGTGLGLSICFGIISEHKGRIWVENSAEGGAIFYVELPIVPVKEALSTVSGLPFARPTLTSSLNPLHILAVDDEPSLLKLIARVLNKTGHTVDTALNGQTALQKLNTVTYDLIICDILMPDILGSELYEQTIEKLPHLADHFIFITGNVVDIDTRVFLEKSNVVWLPKPFLPTDIENAVAQAIAKTKTAV
jgi:two-component system NtrC family sensor kinase